MNLNDFYDNFVGVLSWIVEKIIYISRVVYEWFLGLSWPEKIIFLNGFAAVYAVVGNAARFKIFDSWHYKNNPISVYLVLIAILMFFTIFFCNKIITILRVSFNLWYFIYTLYLLLAEKISKAESYEVCGEYYVNLVVPVIYIGCSIVSYLYYRDY